MQETATDEVSWRLLSSFFFGLFILFFAIAKKQQATVIITGHVSFELQLRELIPHTGTCPTDNTA